MFAYYKTFNPKVFLCHCDVISRFSDFALYIGTQLVYEGTVGKDQEKAQSEKDSHSKNRSGKKPNKQSGTYTMNTFRKPNEQLFSQ